LRILSLTLALALAGCATTQESSKPDSVLQDDGLLASTAIVKRMPVEQASVIEVARFSQARPGGPFPESWEPYVLQRSSPLTTYRITEVGGQPCMEADAANGYSALQRLIRIDPQRNPVVEWRWRVPRLASDAVAAKRVTPRARLMLAFHGDPGKLDFEQRAQLRLAKAVTGQALPYSSLIYVWMNGVPAGTVLPSPYTDRVKLVAMDASKGNFDRWLDLRRNVVEDYRRAFGEDPGDIVGVGIFTDVDGNGAGGLAYYGDITFRER